ncbi:hypothetical protein [Bacillus piscicola]|uniref:hypothetical protein n=1 Tax=Bacillus piscicola TaxID=1632684 RepID=UPI001F0935AC|nr:hypothetical protein [Bacillus piscicola]
MKTQFEIVIFSLFMFLVLFGCDPLAKDTMDFYQNTKSTDLSDESVNSITINSREGEVTTTFGKPYEVEEVANPESKYFNYNGIEFRIVDDKVVRYYFNSTYETAKQLKVGDTKDKVIAAYG